MNRLRFTAIAVLIPLAALLQACAEREGADVPEEASRASTVYAVNYPLAYFAQRIGGDRIDVVLPVPAGIDPAEWQPDAEQVLAFQDADIILLNGAGYARWIERAVLPGSKLVDSSAGFADRLIVEQNEMRHKHGPGGAHDHGRLAATTWLDPQLAALQAQAVCDALTARWPQFADEFAERNRALVEEL